MLMPFFFRGSTTALGGVCISLFGGSLRSYCHSAIQRLSSGYIVNILLEVSLWIKGKHNLSYSTFFLPQTATARLILVFNFFAIINYSHQYRRGSHTFKTEISAVIQKEISHRSIGLTDKSVTMTKGGIMIWS